MQQSEHVWWKLSTQQPLRRGVFARQNWSVFLLTSSNAQCLSLHFKGWWHKGVTKTLAMRTRRHYHLWDISDRKVVSAYEPNFRLLFDVTFWWLWFSLCKSHKSIRLSSSNWCCCAERMYRNTSKPMRSLWMCSTFGVLGGLHITLPLQCLKLPSVESCLTRSSWIDYLLQINKRFVLVKWIKHQTNTAV